MTLSRIAIVCDFEEENWPSMDLVADMLLGNLQRDYSDKLIATRVRPDLRRRLTSKKSGVRNRRTDIGSNLFNADRVLNRFWDYPRFLRRIRNDFDLFHVIDHSYAQLVHELPPERTVVTCHDLDTFQCLLNPAQDPRSIFFRRMMGRTLSGLRKAARVTCVSAATREELLAHDLVQSDRTMVIPNGVHPACSPEPEPGADAEVATLIGADVNDHLDVLHVGSTIPRKRIDFLLRVFASVKEMFSQARLLRVGGEFTAAQWELADNLKLRDSIVVLPRLESSLLAAVYRRAALVLLPSQREGFGLPIVEALACGTAVVASDLPVLREVGGNAVVYCNVAKVEDWKNAIRDLICERRDDVNHTLWRRQEGMAHAAKFNWTEYTAKMVDVYSQLL
jgi:glycosyltransferase involved in cell wall biosynthesis